MKKYLFNVLILLYINFSAQNSSGKITYNHSMDSESLKKLDSMTQKNISKNPRINIWAKNLYKNMPDAKSYLNFTHVESLFFAEDKMDNEGASKINLNKILAGNGDKYYKNTKTNEYFHESSITELLLIEIEPKKWQITQEIKKIGDYLCYKAIDIESTNKKKKPIAWFTPQIPVSFGPLEFSGLPGLVLQVEINKRLITATQIILNPKEEIKIIKPTKGRKISAKENKERVKAFWKSLDEIKD